jgi:hypothetical protein
MRGDRNWETCHASSPLRDQDLAETGRHLPLQGVNLQLGCNGLAGGSIGALSELHGLLEDFFGSLVFGSCGFLGMREE